MIWVYFFLKRESSNEKNTFNKSRKLSNDFFWYKSKFEIYRKIAYRKLLNSELPITATLYSKLY